MLKSLLAVVAVLGLSFSALAEDSKTTTPTGNGGTMETTTDTTHNPMTGNDTTTHETETKDSAGNTTSKRKMKVKRDHKTGKMKKKTVDQKNMDADGDSVEKSHSEESR